MGVPTVLARTEAQLQEWTEKAWPVSYVPIREGPKAHPPKSAGWLRTKKEWIDREVAKVWRAAEEAGRRGEVSDSPSARTMLTIHSTPLP